jgi:hypothetical protein
VAIAFGDMTPLNKSSLVLFGSVLLIGVLGVISFDNFQYLSSIPISNTSFTRSIVLNRSLNLDAYPQASGIDIIKLNGHYYPAYPPGYSFMAVPFYGALQVFNFVWVRLFDPMTAASSLFLESLALELPSILALALLTMLVFRLLVFYKVSTTVASLTAWSLPFTTFLLGYSASAFFHLPAAALLFLSFYLLVSSLNYPLTRSLFVGLAMGGVVLTEYVPAICFIPLGIAFLMRSRSVVKSSVVLAGFVVGLVVLGLYNNYLFGGPLNFGENFAATSGNKEAISKGISFSGNPVTSLVGNYLSITKGLFPNAPLAVLGVLGMWFFFKKKRGDFLLALSFLLIVSGVYAFWHDWGGGWSLGPRFYTSLLPFFFLGAGFFLDQINRNIWEILIFGALGLFGLFTAFWSLMMGPRLIVARALEHFGTPAIQRFNRLPTILAEGEKIPTNVAPHLIQNYKEWPILTSLPFSWWFTIYSLIILLIIMGSLVYLLKLNHDIKRS